MASDTATNIVDRTDDVIMDDISLNQDLRPLLDPRWRTINFEEFQQVLDNTPDGNGDGLVVICIYPNVNIQRFDRERGLTIRRNNLVIAGPFTKTYIFDGSRIGYEEYRDGGKEATITLEGVHNVRLANIELNVSTDDRHGILISNSQSIAIENTTIVSTGNEMNPLLINQQSTVSRLSRINLRNGANGEMYRSRTGDSRITRGENSKFDHY